MIVKPIPITVAEPGIERELSQEQAAETAAGIVKRGRSALQVLRAGEADQPVSEILLLKQNEYNEDDDDSGRRQRLDQR